MTDVLWRLRDLSPGYGNIIKDAVEEIERLRATLLNIQALAEQGNPIDTIKLAERCRNALGQGVGE